MTFYTVRFMSQRLHCEQSSSLRKRFIEKQEASNNAIISIWRTVVLYLE